MPSPAGCAGLDYKAARHPRSCADDQALHKSQDRHSLRAHGCQELTFNYGPQDSDELDDVNATEHADVNVWIPAAAGEPHPVERRSKRARCEPEGM